MDLPDAKTVSPLLDEFSLGKPFSSHNGITCCPAIHTVTKEKFILKQISIPESQIQVDAMLLTGACADRNAAQLYYDGLAKALEAEIHVLADLAQTRGFVPFYNCQTTPKADGEVGVDVWVLSPYRTTLSAYTKRHTMTHLGAVNLGIDLCAALTIARKAGYLYQDLKPENVFITQQKQYQLGDLGFVALDELSYSTFPDKYRSIYTAPELFDDFAEPNTTMDIYALGMLLYRIYNGGAGPFDEDGQSDGEKRRLAGEELPPPKYADYELAAILLKAVAFDPNARWQSPEEMGQAIVSYMQRNPVNDSLIAPPIVNDPVLDTVDLPPEEPEVTPGTELEEVHAQPAEQGPDAAAKADDGSPAASPPEAAEPAPPASVAADEPEDETLPGEEDQAGPVQDQELAEILSRAETFLEIPGVNRPLPEEPEGTANPAPAEEEPPEEDSGPAEGEAGLFPKPHFSVKKPLIFLGVLAVIAALVVGGLYFYRSVYCIPVDSLEVVDVTLDSLTVSLSTGADPADLRLSCQDTYGNTYSAQLQDGRATFTGLNPNTQYTISVSISGFHRLTGQTRISYTTPLMTEITAFTALTGGEDGTMILSFTSDGTEPSQWTLFYGPEGGAEQSVTFTGHTQTLTGLTVGTPYTFRLSAGEEIHLGGTVSITATPSPVVIAQNLHVTEIAEDRVTVAWDEPETPVASWTVTCDDGGDYHVSQTVQGCSVTFEGIDATVSHTIRVTAEGMSENAQFSMTANPVFVQDFQVNTEEPGIITASWTYTGTMAGDWVFLYSFGDSPEATGSIQTAESAVTIDPVLPGTTYAFQIQTADGTTVFGDGVFTATTPEAQDFSGFGLTNGDIDIATFPAPDNEDWDAGDLNSVPQSDNFAPGQSIGFLLVDNGGRENSDAEVQTLVVLRDEQGTPVKYTVGTVPWHTMWTDNLYLGEFSEGLETPGSYQLEIYFDSQLVRSKLITITAE